MVSASGGEVLAVQRTLKLSNISERNLGYVHTYAFSFGFVFGDAVNAQCLTVDTTVFTLFS